MGDFPDLRMPPPPILTPLHPDCIGLGAIAQVGSLGAATSAVWPTANVAFFYAFRLTDWATAYQLLFWVGATSSGNIDVAVCDSQKNRVVSAGSTAMSATVNTVQELNITDTVLPPGDYLLGGACDNTTGTSFRVGIGADEVSLPAVPIYQQAGLTAAAIPDPITPVITTDAAPVLHCIGVQLRPVF